MSSHFVGIVNPTYHVMEHEFDPKPSKCTKCGKNRIIEFVCTFGMDDADEPRAKKIELCKKCSNKRNQCKHTPCLMNYYGEEFD